jgi:hypothetical protein
MAGSAYVVTTTPADIGDALKYEAVTVDVSVPYGGTLDLLHLSFLPLPANLHASVTMAKEGS